MSDHHITMSISLEQWQQVQTQLTEANLEVARLRTQLQHTALGSGQDTLVSAFDAALSIVQFTVGNLPPESVRNWPISSLRTLAISIKAMPGIPTPTLEIANELLRFADECDKVETVRAVQDATGGRAPAPTGTSTVQIGGTLVEG